MNASKHLKGPRASDRFVTTYSHDFKHRSQHRPQLKNRTEAKPGPLFIGPLQTKCETWPMFDKHFYKMTNSTYGSTSQRHSCSLRPDILSSFGPLSDETGSVVPISTETRSQEERVAREGELKDEDKAQQYCIFGRKTKVLQQQEIKHEQHRKIDILYQEDEIVLSSRVGLTCCDGFIRSFSREAGLQPLLKRPVAPSPVSTSYQNKEDWESSAYLWSVSAAIGLNSSTFLQPASKQRSCCAWETEHPDSCSFKIQTIPQSSTLPLVHVQPTDRTAETSRKPLLTEYQSSYAAEWAQPKIQQGDIHRHLSPGMRRFRPSV